MFRVPPQQPCRPQASSPSSAAFRPCRRHPRRRPFQPHPLRRLRRRRRAPSACRPSDLPLPQPLRPALLRLGQRPRRLRRGLLLLLGRRLLAPPLPLRLRPGPLLLGRQLLVPPLPPRLQAGPPPLPPAQPLLAPPPLLRLRPGPPQAPPQFQAPPAQRPPLGPPRLPPPVPPCASWRPGRRWPRDRPPQPPVRRPLAPPLLRLRPELPQGPLQFQAPPRQRPPLGSPR